MKVEKIKLEPSNRMLRIGFGKHDSVWFARFDLWFIGIRFKINKNKNMSDKKNGFFPLDILDKKPMKIVITCPDPEHNPPTNLVIPQGMGYRHTCPTCGERKTIIPSQVTM